MNGQIDLLRTKWPQAFIHPDRNSGGESLVVVPGYKLPKGYNKTICTVLFLAYLSEKTVVQPLEDFWIDTPDLQLAQPSEVTHGYAPRRSCVCGGPWDGASPCYWHRGGSWDGIPGFPEWKDLRFFLWHAQRWNPNKDTLYTAMMVVKRRLDIVV